MKLKLRLTLLALVTAVISPLLLADSGLPSRPAGLPAGANVAGAGSHAVARGYANLPLHFEPTAEPGRFVARSGNGYAVMIGARESVVTIPGADSTRSLRFAFDQANAGAQIEAIEPLPGVSNYYLGNDPSQWRLGVRNFAKVRAQEIYPGVDVVYYGDDRRLEFDFLVAPMANPGAIVLTLSGMDKLYLDADGNLVAEINGHAVSFAKPYAYQKRADGLAKRVSVEYTLSAPDKAQLKVGDYDKTLALVIDPIMQYSTFLGGSLGDTANGIAVDTSSNAYITGQTCSIGLDSGSNPEVVFPGIPYATWAAYNSSSPAGPAAAPGTCIAYVSKLNAAGSTVLFTTYIGGTAPNPQNASASGSGIALDNVALNPTPSPNGYPNVYVVGTTVFKDMPVPACNIPGKPVAPQCASGGGYYVDTTPYPSVSPYWPGGDSDAFIAILNSQTGTLIRSAYLGGSGVDHGYSIAVDPQQNVIVGGQTTSLDFPGYNGFEPKTEAMVGFITKLDFGLHIAPKILPGASPMSPRPPSNTESCGDNCPAAPDPTHAYFFFSAVYGGQLVTPPQTWLWQPNTTVAYGTITTLTPYCTQTTPPTSYAPLRVVAMNGGTTSFSSVPWEQSNMCTNGILGAEILDNGANAANTSFTTTGVNWMVIGVAAANGFIGPISAATETYGVALDSHSDVFAVGGSSTTQLHPSLPGPGYVQGGFDWLPQADTYDNGTGSWLLKLKSQGSQGGYLTVIQPSGTSIPYPYNYPSGVNAGWPVYVTTLETTMTDPSATVDAARAITVDSQNNAYVVGTATGTLISGGGLNESPLGGNDAYIVKMQTPAEILYSTYLGGAGSDQGLAVTVDGGGNAYVAGSTESTSTYQSGSLPIVNPIVDGAGNAQNELKGSNTEAYLAMLAPNGMSLEMSTYLGGSQGDQANAIALNPLTSDIFLAGNSSSYDFPIVPVPGLNAVPGISANAGKGDAFVARILGASFPAISISPASQLVDFTTPVVVDFPSSTTMPVVLTSTGQMPLTLSNPVAGAQAITILTSANSTTPSQEFTQTNNCGSGLPADTSPQNTCTINVTFIPQSNGTRSATLYIYDNATNNTSPQTVSLTGTGQLVQDSVSPTILSFGAVNAGATSAPLTVTLTNTDSGTNTLVPSSSPPVASPTGVFTVVSNTCTTHLTPGQSCTIGVTYTPSTGTQQSGTLVINTANGDTLPNVSLTGTGNGGGGGTGTTTSTTSTFTMSPTTQSMAITAGTPLTIPVILTAANGFSQSVSLTCQGYGGATCSPATKTTFVNATSPSTVNLTVNVAGKSGPTVTEVMRPGRLLACLLPFGGIGLVLVSRRKRWWLLLALAICLALGLVACGGGASNSSTMQPQVTVTATSQDGTVTQTATYYLNAS